MSRQKTQQSGKDGETGKRRSRPAFERHAVLCWARAAAPGDEVANFELLSRPEPEPHSASEASCFSPQKPSPQLVAKMASPASLLRAFGLLIAFLSVLSACAAPPEEPSVQPECEQNVDCSGGLVCVEGACVPCRMDRECARTEHCHPIDKICLFRPCFGDECKGHDDCSLGQLCVQGLCLTHSQEHPSGCSVESCTTSQSCGEGRICHRVNRVCEEDLGCFSDEDCGPEESCHLATGRCEASCSEENAKERCGLLRVCSEGTCVDCSDDRHCGPGLSCDPVTSECRSLYSCTSNRDCEMPQVCNMRTGQCSDVQRPCSSDDQCGKDESCNTARGICQPRQCLPDRFAPNQRLDDAALIAVGTTGELRACHREPSFFRLPLAAGDRFAVALDADPLFPLELALLGSEGQLLTRNKEHYAEAVALNSADHFIRVSSDDLHAAFGMRVYVSRGVPCEPGEGKFNGEFVDAIPVPPGVYHGRICPGYRDWYTLDVPRNKGLRAELMSSPGENPLAIYLYDSDGTSLLAAGEGGSSQEIVESPSVKGSRAYVLVQGSDPGVQNGYSLRLRLLD